MPAAAVIPAPIAYIKVVAVKKLVVEFQGFLVLAMVRLCGHVLSVAGLFFWGNTHVFSLDVCGGPGLLL